MLRTKLKTKRIEGWEIDYGDLEEFVHEVYGDKNYSFVATEECGNDSTHEFNPESKNTKSRKAMAEFDAKEHASIRAGKVPSYGNRYLFQVLVDDGHLEPGTYYVNVCW